MIRKKGLCMTETTLFSVFATFTLLSALMVIRAKNPVYSVLFLILVFCNAAGLLVLLVVIYNHFKYKYTSDNMLGFELGAIFWHFVDILWIYLFFFFYFIR